MRLRFVKFKSVGSLETDLLQCPLKLDRSNNVEFYRSLNNKETSRKKALQNNPCFFMLGCEVKI